MALYPYLYFGGSCREAFTRYQEVFGGELVLIRYADMPAEEGATVEHKELIAHAALRFGDDVLMASDDPTGDPRPVRGIFVNYATAGAAEAERLFAALADGGDVTAPPIETSFSPRFGMCTDRFGIPWMIMAEGPRPE